MQSGILFLGETFICHINLHNESGVECKNVVLKKSSRNKTSANSVREKLFDQNPFSVLEVQRIPSSSLCQRTSFPFLSLFPSEDKTRTHCFAYD
ncbi:hypothetical protein TcWFU_004467 [Taenia crassiceps]|uniref:Uncharacterized protein n=1 Tax=Taenia crassiceps TaxID=6207 RepID=A0ABR4Q0S8_9CEST